jgi:hypothetical protein
LIKAFNFALYIFYFTIQYTYTRGFGVLGFWGLGFGVQGSGFRVQGSGFRVQGSGFRV